MPYRCVVLMLTALLVCRPTNAAEAAPSQPA